MTSLDDFILVQPEITGRAVLGLEQNLNSLIEAVEGLSTIVNALDERA